MKKINENTKVTLTIGQIRRLLKEYQVGTYDMTDSIEGDDYRLVSKPSFKEWVEKELKQQEDYYGYTPKGIERIDVNDYPMDDEKYVEELAGAVHTRPENIEAAVMLSCAGGDLDCLDWIGDLVSEFANRFAGDVRYTVDLDTEAVYVAKISQSNIS